jgi:hypothetical protein
MKPQDVVKFAGTKRAAFRMAGVTRMTWWTWEQTEQIPIEHQCLIEIVSAGVLRADRKALLEMS